MEESIRSYYDRRPEESRLLQGVSQLEAERTKELVKRFAPPPPRVIYDVGGAAGYYSFWLAQEGYEVHLLDAVPRLIDLARARLSDAEVSIATIELGDARHLPYSSDSADCVLLLGPLYHLTERVERIRAISEAARVLKPGGLLFAACITRWASLFDGLTFDFLADEQFRALMEADLASGQHRNPSDKESYFTTAYFHTPGELKGEIEESRLRVEGLFGLEGPGRFLTDFNARWADERRRTAILRAARAIETEPTLLGLSPHLMAIGRK